LLGVAVNVRAAPAHAGFEPPVSAIETDGIEIAFTVIVIELDVAGLPITPERFDVIMQVTTWPFVNELLVYTGLLVPTLMPFTCHW
jgi:hypothetical protein